MTSRGRAALSERNQWRRRAAKPRTAKRVTLDAPFAGLAKGTVLYIGTPAILEEYLASIPPGETRTLQRLRRDIARANRCQAMCPVSTALFLRMIAEVAWDEICDGRAAGEVIPFWRVIAPGSPIARRLRVPESWLRARLELELGARVP
jgi:hypothetical protein